MRVKILETDQWTSSGNVAGTKLKDWELDMSSMLGNVTGGDAEAARVIFGGKAQVREVDENNTPDLGSVWFKPDNAGLLRKWKTNYDSSG